MVADPLQMTVLISALIDTPYACSDSRSDGYFCTRDLFWHTGHVLLPSWTQNSTACKHEEDKWELGSVI